MSNIKYKSEHLLYINKLYKQGISYSTIAKAVEDKFNITCNRNNVGNIVHRLNKKPEIKPVKLNKKISYDEFVKMLHED